VGCCRSIWQAAWAHRDIPTRTKIKQEKSKRTTSKQEKSSNASPPFDVRRLGRLPRVTLAGAADVALGRLLHGVADGDAKVHAKSSKKAGKRKMCGVADETRCASHMIARNKNEKRRMETEKGTSFLKVEISFTAFRSIPGRLIMPALHMRSSKPSPRLRILPACRQRANG